MSIRLAIGLVPSGFDYLGYFAPLTDQTIEWNKHFYCAAVEACTREYNEVYSLIPSLRNIDSLSVMIQKRK